MILHFFFLYHNETFSPIRVDRQLSWCLPSGIRKLNTSTEEQWWRLCIWSYDATSSSLASWRKKEIRKKRNAEKNHEKKSARLYFRNKECMHTGVFLLASQLRERKEQKGETGGSEKLVHDKSCVHPHKKLIYITVINIFSSQTQFIHTKYFIDPKNIRPEMNGPEPISTSRLCSPPSLNYKNSNARNTNNCN